MGHFFVAGASRRVGFKTVELLRRFDHQVTCFFRSQDALDSIKDLGASPYIVDAFDAAAMENLLRNSPKADAFICTLGSNSEDQRRIDHIGASNCISLAKRFKIGRFLLVTAIGCGATWEFLPEKVKQFLGPAIEAKNKAESELLQSELNYTILRPGALSDDAATGNAFCTKSVQVQGEVTRADVARILVNCVGSKNAQNCVFQVLDRERLRSQHIFEEITL